MKNKRVNLAIIIGLLIIGGAVLNDLKIETTAKALLVLAGLLFCVAPFLTED